MVVSTGYTADEYTAIESAADFLGLAMAEFQATGVYVIDYLTQLADGDPDSLTDVPETTGTESITLTWDEESQEVLNRVATGYAITPAEAQKFGAYLLTFFVGLTRG